MSVDNELYMKDYAVVTLNGVRYYIGKHVTPYPQKVYEEVQNGWSNYGPGPAPTYTWHWTGDYIVGFNDSPVLFVCGFMGDSDTRFPIYWYTGQDGRIHPIFYVPLYTGDYFTAEDMEIPIVYTYGTKIVIDTCQSTDNIAPSEGYEGCYQKAITVWSNDQHHVAERIPLVAYSQYTYSEYSIFFVGDYFFTRNYTSNIVNDIYYAVGTYVGDSLPVELPYEDFTINDVMCFSCKVFGEYTYSGDHIIHTESGDLFRTCPTTHPIMYPSGSYLSKVCVSEYCKENNVRPILTHDGTALYAIIPTATAGVQETYKSTDGGGTWLAV